MISERIVVIDDNMKIIKSIKMALIEYEIIDFPCGEKAIEFFKKPNEINLVLLDVFMDGMNGITVLKELKKVNKDLSVIIMTAYGSKDIVLQALRSHADDFIEKPFNINDLKGKIKNILKEKIYLSCANSSKEEQIDRIKRFIDRNYNNANLEYISNELCISPKYLSRMFNRKSNCSFRTYKLGVKIAKAKYFLKETNINVSEIAVELGYQNPESFMRIFKKITTMTPMQYRKKFNLKQHRSNNMKAAVSF
ncbi:MAG: response regulator transcription factor [Candidatus Omnitrophica bacterium]|nr:response regulator transcription factor [Candidatus Omnitrophota bacterium]